VIWVFLPRGFRQFGQRWLSFMAYRYWRRFSLGGAALKERMRELIARMLGAPAS
jgi:hypothetical protein